MKIENGDVESNGEIESVGFQTEVPDLIGERERERIVEIGRAHV